MNSINSLKGNQLFIIFLLLLLHCQVVALAGEREKAPTERKPNIVFILADDLGYNDVGFMGSKYYETPNLDRIAKAGTVFMNAYANAPVCSPSRASLMTGQFTPRHGITDWIGAASGENWRKNGRYDKLLPPPYQRSLAPDQVILPQVLNQQGYKTFIAGKWHLGGKDDSPSPYFETCIGGFRQGPWHNGFYFAPYRNSTFIDAPDGEDLSIRLGEETSKFIRANKSSSFFAYLSFYAVHGPIQTTRAKWAKYREKAERQGLQQNGFAMGPVLPYRLYQDNPVYAGLIESMDDAIGIVLRTLEEEKLLDNTIIVFTSDNGGVHAGDSYSTSLTPLKGGKGTQWEGGLKVPLVIKLVKGKSAPKKIGDPVIGSDLFPTLLELAGLPLRPGIHVDGQSLSPLLKGKKLAGRAFVWHYPHYGNQGGAPSSIILKNGWKLISYYESAQQSLYYLPNDIGEDHDLINEKKDLAGDLFSELSSYLNQTGAKFPTSDQSFDPQKRKDWELKQVNELLPELEKNRASMLRKDYQPNSNWWGSEP